MSLRGRPIRTSQSSKPNFLHATVRAIIRIVIDLVYGPGLVCLRYREATADLKLKLTKVRRICSGFSCFLTSG